MLGAEPQVGLRRNANWLKLWSGQAASLVGDFVLTTTVVLWVAAVIAAGQSWAPVAVSGVLIASAAPILLVGPLAGVYVDRFDRRRIMLIADLARAGFIGVLVLVSLVADGWPVFLRLGVVYAMVALSSSAAQFFNPSRFAVISTIMAEPDRARAFGLLTATSSTAAVVGPPLAAPLLFGIGVTWALSVTAAGYLASFLAVWAIRMPATGGAARTGGSRFWRELRDGLRFFVGSRTLVVMAGAVCVYMFGVGAINVLDVFFITENLHTDPSRLGALKAAIGVGSIIGALLVGRLTGWLGDVRVFALGLTATGLAVLAYSRAESLPPALVLVALAGVPLAMVNAVTGPIVLRSTPQHLLGRINSVLNPLIYLASIGSMALAGVVSAALEGLHATVAGVTVGRIDAIFGVGALLMIASGLLAYRPMARHAAAAPADAATPGGGPGASEHGGDGAEATGDPDRAASGGGAAPVADRSAGA